MQNNEIMIDFLIYKKTAIWLFFSVHIHDKLTAEVRIIRKGVFSRGKKLYICCQWHRGNNGIGV